MEPVPDDSAKDSQIKFNCKYMSILRISQKPRLIDLDRMTNEYGGLTGIAIAITC